MGEAREAVVLRGLRQVAVVEGGGDAGGWVSSGAGSAAGTTSSGSSSLFSSTSSLTDQEDDDDDDATSSLPADRHISSSSSSSLTSSESETMQMDAAAGGPLHELSTMLDHLPALRTGLSKYYHGRSQSFTSLADVSCVDDLAKKTAPYTRRKAPRGCAAALGAKNWLSKTIAKKAPRGSQDQLLPRARSTGLSASSGKPPSYLGKREMHRC